MFLLRNTNFTFLITTSSIILFIYWPGISGPLILDDWPQIVPLIHGITPGNWADNYEQYIFSNSGVLKRPVSMLSFIFNAITIGDDIRYWKLTNVVLHLFSGFSIFILTSILLSFSKNNKTNIHIISFGVSATWLLHPLHVSTVLYLVQRMTILSTLFTTSALSCYLYALNKALIKEQCKTPLAISIIILFPLAIFSKENAALMPIYVLLLTLYVMQTTSTTFMQLPKIIKTYNFLMLTIIMFGLVILLIYQDRLIHSNYLTREFTLSQRLLTEPRVLLMYLAQIIIPNPSLMGFFHDDYSISKSIINPFSTITSILFILLLLIIISIKKNKYPLISFGVLIFFSSHLFESTIFPLEIAFEHRNYLGMWGIILAGTYTLQLIHEKTVYLLIPLCLLLACLTYNRTTIWGDPNLMYPHMLSIHPNSIRLNSIFSETYMSSGQYDEALAYLSPYDGFGTQLQRLTIICNRDGLLKNGLLVNSTHHNHLKIGTYEMEGIITLSNLGLDNICLFSKNQFIELLSTVTKSTALKNTDAQKVFIYLAHYHHQLGHSSQAIKALESSFTKDTDNPIPLFLMVEWLLEYNQNDKAIIIFTKAKSIANLSYYNYSDFIDRISILIKHL